MLGTILIVLLILALLGGLPTWGWHSSYSGGYVPSAVLLVILIVAVLAIYGGTSGP